MASLKDTTIYGDLKVSKNITLTGEDASVTAASFIGNASKVYNTTTGELELVSAKMAGDDYFRILVGGATDEGYAEIATADNGTEPIYVRQYTGAFTTLTRTATLLDGSGNTSFPGGLSANRVYNAVWNYIADFLEVDEDIDIEYGKAYFRDNNGKVRKTNKRNSYSIGITSDTFGFGVGRKDENIKQIPIAIGGWVLAHVDNIYKAGTPLIATKDGNLTKASLLTKYFYPERIIAVFDREEKEEFWNKIKVAGRCWVKVK